MLQIYHRKTKDLYLVILYEVAQEIKDGECKMFKQSKRRTSMLQEAKA